MRRIVALVLLLPAFPALAGSLPEPTPEASPVATARPEPTPDAAATATPTPEATATPPEATATPARPAATPAPHATPFDDTDAEMRRPRSARLAGWLSLAFPGAGQLYVGEPGRGAIFLGAETAELGAAVTTIATSGWDPEDETDTRYRRAMLPLAWLQNTHLLNVYDAWRLARERAPAGRYDILPTPGTTGLLKAPFSGRQLTRPEVMIPLGTVWALAIGLSATADGGEAKFTELTRIPVFSREVDRWAALGVATGYYSATFYSVGIGEEAVFRGVVQTAAEERLGPTWGWVTATLFFASLHAANGTTAGESATAVAATALVGGYLGWLYRHDGHDLTGAVFFHAWYDVAIGLATFLLDPEHQPFTARFAIAF